MQTVSPNPESQEQTANKPSESPELLHAYMSYFNREKYCGERRKERIEKLMRRKSADKWTKAKKQKMVRRLFAASNQAQNADDTIEQIKVRLSQIQNQATQ